MTFKLGDLAPEVPKRRCWRKVAHQTREEAEAQHGSMVERGIGNPLMLDVYLCQYCGRFHVGHNRRKERAMTDFVEALRDGGKLVVFLGTGYEPPEAFARHGQVRWVVANEVLPKRVAEVMENARAVVLTDNIDHRTYLAINAELRQRKLPFVLRKGAAALLDTVQQIFPSKEGGEVAVEAPARRTWTAARRAAVAETRPAAVVLEETLAKLEVLMDWARAGDEREEMLRRQVQEQRARADDLLRRLTLAEQRAVEAERKVELIRSTFGQLLAPEPLLTTVGGGKA